LQYPSKNGDPKPINLTQKKETKNASSIHQSNVEVQRKKERKKELQGVVGSVQREEDSVCIHLLQVWA
jgi:hypothetical protein